MKIAVLGASGKTGKVFVKYAVENGWELRCLVRNPEKLGRYRFQLPIEVIKGNAVNIVDVRKTLTGCTHVVSFLGHSLKTPPNLQQVATKNVIEVMENSEIKKFFMLTGSAIPDDNDIPSLKDEVYAAFFRNLAEKRYNDALKSVNLLKKSSINYTVIRAN